MNPNNTIVETFTLAPNPACAAGAPMSYESTLCRLAGWWTMSPNLSSLSPREVALLQLDA